MEAETTLEATGVAPQAKEVSSVILETIGTSGQAEGRVEKKDASIDRVRQCLAPRIKLTILFRHHLCIRRVAAY